MQNQIAARNEAESPFFSLLSEADHVQVREISVDNKERMVSSLERTLKDFELEKDTSSLRTFFVHIRVPAPRAPEEEVAAYERENLIASAKVLLDNSEFVLARNIYSYLLKDGMRDPAALQGLGICLFRLGEIVSAKKCFRAVCDLNGETQSWFWLGQCCLAEVNDTAAAECFAKTGPLPKDLQFELFKNWGNCLTRLGKAEEAAQKYEQALKLNPSSDVLLVNLGTLAIQMRDHATAEIWFRRALEINPKSSKAVCGLGLIALTYGHIAQAHDLLQTSLDLDSQNIVALHQLVLLSQGPLPHADVKPRLIEFLTRDPGNAEAHYALAVILFKEGAWKDCEGHIDKALASDPSHARAQELKAEVTKLKR